MTTPTRSRFSLSFAIAILLSAFSFSKTHAQPEAPSFVGNIPSKHTEILIVNDPADQLQSLLSNRALQRVLTEGIVSARRPGPNPQEGLNWLNENRTWFPKTAVVAGDQQIYPFLIDFLQLMIHGTLIQEALTPEKDYQEDLATALKDLEELIGNLVLPSLCVYADWEDESSTDTIYKLIAGNTGQIKLFAPALDIESNDQQISISGKIENLVSRLILTAIVEEFFGDSVQPSLTDKIAAIPFYLKAERLGPGILISLASTATKTQPTQLQSLPDYQASNSQMIYTRWNIGKFKSAAQKLPTMKSKWAKTTLGKNAIANDSEGIWSSINEIAQQLKSAPNKGHFRFEKTPGKIAGIGNYYDTTAALTLAESGIFKKIPANVESYFASSNLSVANFASGILDYFEQKVGQIEFKAALSADEVQGELAATVSNIYFTNFVKFRNQIRNELPKHCGPSSALLLRSTGKLDSFKISPLSSGRVRLDTAAEKLPEIVCIADCKSPKKLESVLVGAYRALVEGTIKTAKSPEIPNLKITTELQLTRDITATQLTYDWLDQADIASIEIDGDLNLHMFALGDYFILSSSEKFSRSIIEAQDKVKLPAPTSTGQLVQHGQTTGQELGNLFSASLNIYFKAAAQSLDVPFTFFEDIPNAFQELTEIMDKIQWQAKQSGSNQTLRLEIEFLTE